MADWPGPLPATAEAAEMLLAARTGAYGRITRDLPVAARIHAVQDWLRKAPVEELLHQLLACVVAADCHGARLVCPSKRFVGAPWQRYLQQRQQALAPLLAQSLARWAVLERIPAHWIPVAHVHAAVADHAARVGLRTAVTAVGLVPPVLGGQHWLRNDGAEAGPHALSALAADRAVAAVLHWPERTAAAVVTPAATPGRLMAFGSAFGADGLQFDVAALSGAVLVNAAMPPVTGLNWWLATLRLRDAGWRWVRQRRIRRNGPGAQSDAAI